MQNNYDDRTTKKNFKINRPVIGSVLVFLSAVGLVLAFQNCSSNPGDSSNGGSVGALSTPTPTPVATPPPVTSTALPLDFDTVFYQAAYPDLAAMTVAEAQDHYIMYGGAEGRCYKYGQSGCVPARMSGFDVAYYRQFPDLPTNWTDREVAIHFLTSGANENRCRSGVALSCTRPPALDPLKFIRHIYRFNRTDTGGHFFTLDRNEVNGNANFNLENVGFVLFDQGGNSRVELRRCSIASTGTHFISSATDCEGNNIEGSLGFVEPSATALAPHALYRCYKAGPGHLSTTNVSECQISGYTVEYIQGYVP